MSAKNQNKKNKIKGEDTNILHGTIINEADSVEPQVRAGEGHKQGEEDDLKEFRNTMQKYDKSQKTEQAPKSPFNYVPDIGDHRDYYFNSLMNKLRNTKLKSEVLLNVELIKQSGFTDLKVYLKKCKSIRDALKSFSKLNTFKVEYNRIERNLMAFETCLNSNSLFLAGLSLYESLETNNSVIKRPLLNAKLVGSTICIVHGYDHKTRMFKIFDTITSTFHTLAYDYLLDSNLSDDFWMIKF